MLIAEHIMPGNGADNYSFADTFSNDLEGNLFGSLLDQKINDPSAPGQQFIDHNQAPNQEISSPDRPLTDPPNSITEPEPQSTDNQIHESRETVADKETRETQNIQNSDQQKQTADQKDQVDQATEAEIAADKQKKYRKYSSC